MEWNQVLGGEQREGLEETGGKGKRQRTQRRKKEEEKAERLDIKGKKLNGSSHERHCWQPLVP